MRTLLPTGTWSPKTQPSMSSVDSSQPTLPAKGVGDASPKWELPGAGLHPSPVWALRRRLVCWSGWGNPHTLRTTRHYDTAEPIPGAWAAPLDTRGPLLPRLGRRVLLLPGPVAPDTPLPSLLPTGGWAGSSGACEPNRAAPMGP